jgi:hypothetical protein
VSLSCSANGHRLDAGIDAGNSDWYPINLSTVSTEAGAPWVTDTGEVFDIDVAPLWPTLPASDFDASMLGLSISYLTLPANGATAGFVFASAIDSGIPTFTDIKLLFDGEEAPGCTFTPGAITCPSVSTSVREIAFSFAYDGSQGFVGIAMSIGNTAASCALCGG